MDAAGRIVLPKPVRERAGLAAGMRLEIRIVDGRIEIEPAPARVTVEKKDGFWIARPEDAVPVLRQGEVDRTIDEVRAPVDRLESQ